MASKEPNIHHTPKNHAGISGIQIGFIIAVAALIAGIAFFAFMTPQKPTANPTTPNVALHPGNSTMPKEATLTGKASCSNGTQTSVFLLTDPYCPACAAIEPQVNAFYKAFHTKADIQYLIVATHSRSLAPAYGVDTVFQAHDYFICAQEQNKIQEFKKCFYGQLILQNGEYIPESKAQLQSCANSAQLNQTQLNACLPSARPHVDANNVKAVDLLGSPFSTPTAVIDCQYEVHSALVKQTYCAFTKSC